MNWLVVFASLIFALPHLISSAAATVFDKETCTNVDLINEEIIQLELAGARWQNGQSQCLNQKNFKTVVAEKETLNGHAFQRPAHLLPVNRKVEIISQTWDDTLAQMTLSVRYLDRADQQVTDELTYRMNFGEKRAEKGCASLISDLTNFVMREDCFQKVDKKNLNRKISSD
jgi:hypothetical protein